MVSTSRLVSDEDLKKAKDDSKEQINPGPIPSNSEEDNKKEKEDKTGKKKKKLCVVPQEYVDMLLNYQCRFYEHKNIDRLAEQDEQRYGHYKKLVTEADEITKRDHVAIREYQERIRRQIETKGYVSYEVTDDEGEDEDEGVTTFQMGPHGRGRRRHRPGIVKHAGGGVKKLN